MKIKEIAKIRKIKRSCAICGKDILIKIFPNGKYAGGNYFHNISECKPNGHCPNLYLKPENSPLPPSSAPSCASQRKVRANPYLYEYWECDSCYNNLE